MKNRVLPTLLVCLLAAVTIPARGEKTAPVAAFTAFAVQMQSGQAGIVDITINRWSTDAERTALIDTLQKEGGAALFDALQKLPRVGYIKLPNTLGWDLHYARQNPQPDGSRQIVIATDRPLTGFELRNQPRSRKYDLMLIQLQIPASGKGEGKLAGAVEVTVSKKTGQIEIENYGTSPTLLKDVKERKAGSEKP